MSMVVPRTEPRPDERKPPLDPTYLAMAAAVMEQKGRLGPPQKFEKTPNTRVKEGFESLDREPALFGTRGDEQLYLDKQDKYNLGKTT